MTTLLTDEEAKRYEVLRRDGSTIRALMEKGDWAGLQRWDQNPAFAAWKGPRSGTTLLHLATNWKLDPVLAVPFLLRQGLDPMVLDQQGRSTHSYLFNGPPATRLLWLKTLVAHGLPADLPNADGQTALSMAVKARDEACLAWLIEAGVQATQVDHHKVRHSNHRPSAALFWEAFGMPLTAEEITADFLRACSEGRWSYAWAMLDAGANPLAKNSRGFSSLMLACDRARPPVDLIQRLVELGVDPAQTVTLDHGEVANARTLMERKLEGNRKAERRWTDASLAMARGRQHRLETQVAEQAHPVAHSTRARL